MSKRQDTYTNAESDLVDRKQLFQEIMEWLYINDGGYNDKLAWRREFVDHIRQLILGESGRYHRRPGDGDPYLD